MAGCIQLGVSLGSLYPFSILLTSRGRKYRNDVAPSEWAEPAALITTDSGLLFAASLLQALFAIPQLRLAIKHLHLNVEDSSGEADRTYCSEAESQPFTQLFPRRDTRDPSTIHGP